ncbi:MAG: tetratricopeptide repeat protein, partial [Candidatus Sulfotelmatobacter sp.]
MSSQHILLLSFGWLLAASVAVAISPQSPGDAAQPRNRTRSGAAEDPGRLFQAGQDALNRGQLDEAEHDFRQVLALNPAVGGAYANLGVVYMRRKQFSQALE